MHIDLPSAPEAPAFGASGLSETASHTLAQLTEGGSSHVLQDLEAVQNSQRLQVKFNVNKNAIDDWQAGSVDSVFEKAKQFNSLKFDSETYKHGQVPLDVRRGELPPAVLPLPRVQEATLQITGDIGLLTDIQAAQLKVAQLSCTRVPIAVTPEDAVKYRTARTLVTDLWDASDWTKKELAMNRWRRTVSRAVGKARLNCEKDEGLWELDLEEEDCMTTCDKT
ncbi:hypothetical protein C8R43DRAFT_1130465 [Mycena crocata]|nr:hypothetical protein C8R43DRAFT_1130465 [Mycena crocata]